MPETRQRSFFFYPEHESQQENKIVAVGLCFLDNKSGLLRVVYYIQIYCGLFCGHDILRYPKPNTYLRSYSGATGQNVRRKIFRTHVV